MKVVDLLVHKECWTRYENARNIRGIPVFPNNDDAVCWCLYGALDKCYGEGTTAMLNAKHNLLGEIQSLVGRGNTGITDFNDDSAVSFELVRQVLEAADV